MGGDGNRAVAGWLLRAAFCAVVARLLVAGGVVCAQSQEPSAERRFENYRSGFHMDTLALQVQLDRRSFSCNCADGVWGPRTAIALLTWQTLQGVAATGVPDADTLDALGGDKDVLMRYTVSPEDHAALCAIPDDWDERAKLKAMGYETIQEMLAEKGHTSQKAIERLNPGLVWPNPPAGTEVVVPNCAAPKPERASSLRISLGRMEVTAFDVSGRLVALFPCSIAKDKARRPAGELTVKCVAPRPNYTYDPQLFEPGGAKKAKLVVPPGPNNPVGMAWIGLSLSGYGMHGTPIPERIGRAESHGCFRLANWNALKLIEMVEVGMPVIVED